jgi:hypothetical protein
MCKLGVQGARDTRSSKDRLDITPICHLIHRVCTAWVLFLWKSYKVIRDVSSYAEPQNVFGGTIRIWPDVIWRANRPMKVSVAL